MRSCSHTDIDSSYLYLLNYFNDVSTMEHVHENWPRENIGVWDYITTFPSASRFQTPRPGYLINNLVK